jgi:hypothetical protein
MVAAAGTAFYLSETSVSAVRRFGVIGGVAAAAAGVAAGVALLFRHHANRLPVPPDKDDVPSLPDAGVAPLGSPGNPSVNNHSLGELYGHWTVTKVVSVPDSDGSGSHMETRTESHSTRWNLVPRQQTGRMDGYATLDDAIADTAQKDVTTIYRKNNGRIEAYVADPGDNWGRVDDITVTDANVVAFVGDDGERYSPSAAHTWGPERSRPQGGLSEQDDLYREIAKWKMRNASDPSTWISGRVSPKAGYETLEQALGDMASRPGDQAIAKDGTAYQVFATDSSRIDATQELQALLATPAGQKLSALETHDATFVPAGQYWMSRDPGVAPPE